jgi:AmmeMemoRadiSam system protein B
MERQSPSIRPAAVAGQFYAADPRRLQATVADLLAAAPRCAAAAPKALIAPHAGYIYSGAVAAAAFATLREFRQSIGRVVLIGPAHYVAVRGIAAPSAHSFATPLGRVPVDREAIGLVADLVVKNDAPHVPEHALEVELPFLQSVLHAFTIVPLLVGDGAAAQVADVLGRLWGGPDTLLVVSSDLSHYHDYDSARRLDAATAANIERGTCKCLGPESACGFLAVAGLVEAASRHGLKAQRLALCNSGDTAGSRDRVVGYGAWMFASP